jgi:hypothetical protein
MKENKPAANHPWRKWGDDYKKLKSARKAREKIKSADRSFEWYRDFHGIPRDAPKYNPWALRKGVLQ